VIDRLYIDATDRHRRLCSVLYVWVSAYPADLIYYHSIPGNGFKSFLEAMLFQPHLNHYAVDLLPLLKTVERLPGDPETWALPDRPADGDSPSVGRKQSTSIASLASSALLSIPATPSDNSFPKSDSTAPSSTTDKQMRARALSDAETTQSGTSQSSDRTGFKRTSRKSGEVSLLALSNELAEADPKEVAYQITRLTWQIFSDICVRAGIPHGVR
jgi:hypothetical protein